MLLLTIEYLRKLY
ncbi:hypothetical protein GQ607_017764 [Colletotrichum asianum]|uniref:Uncharacterized protein n=1 Tax=Colletotrichum asianum TaxID=702518 RepID=A0A8H3VR99_9PEZI|nr:hypothetical protein GQ607_017764 [Colletotrichum asianum]